MSARYRRYRLTGVWWIDALIVLLILAVIFLPWLLKAHWPKIGQLFARKEETRAEVIDLRAEACVVGRRGTEDLYVHYAWFRTALGEQLQMPVPEEAYIGLCIGDEGVLTHKGAWYLDFRVTHRAGKETAIFKDYE